MKTTIRWQPEQRQKYWMVNDRGNPYETEWRGCQIDYLLWNVGNCYATKQQADEIAKFVKAAYKGNGTQEQETNELEQENRNLRNEIDNKNKLISAMSQRMAGKDAEIKFYQELISKNENHKNNNAR